MSVDIIAQIDILDNKRNTLQKELSIVQDSLDSAKARRRATKQYADPIWFAEQTSKVRNLTNEIHEISRQIKNLRRQLPKPISAFESAAQEILDKDVFNQIKQKASEVVNGEV